VNYKTAFAEPGQKPPIERIIFEFMFASIKLRSEMERLFRQGKTDEEIVEDFPDVVNTSVLIENGTEIFLRLAGDRMRVGRNGKISHISTLDFVRFVRRHRKLFVAREHESTWRWGQDEHLVREHAPFGRGVINTEPLHGGKESGKWGRKFLRLNLHRPRQVNS